MFSNNTNLYWDIRAYDALIRVKTNLDVVANVNILAQGQAGGNRDRNGHHYGQMIHAEVGAIAHLSVQHQLARFGLVAGRVGRPAYQFQFCSPDAVAAAVPDIGVNGKLLARRYATAVDADAHLDGADAPQRPAGLSGLRRSLPKRISFILTYVRKETQGFKGFLSVLLHLLFGS